MNRNMIRVKTISTVFILMLLLFCTVAPAVNAKNVINKYGARRSGNNGTHYSYTRVKAYDENGYALNLIVSASLGRTGWKYEYGKGEVSANSRPIVTTDDAWHGYGIGTSIDSNNDWKQN
jgi:hypothetical protein